MGVALLYATALTGAIKVKVGTITSSPDETPADLNET